MNTKRMPGLVLCALLPTATQAGAQAQVTQLRVEFNERVVEITEPVMRGFMNGLDVELRLVVEYAKLLATYKTPAEYRHCSAQAARLPEFQKIQEQVLTWPENPTPEQAQRLAEKMAADQAALLKQKCGGDIETEWPDTKRREKIEEIQTKAALAAGPVNSPPSPPSRPRGPAALDNTQDADLVQGQGPSTETERQRQKIKQERTNQYCMAKEAMKEAIWEVREVVRELTNPGQPTKLPTLVLPGKGTASWVYTDDEGKAIGPNCEELRPKILVLEMLEAKIADCPGGTECVTIRVGEAVEVPKLKLEMLGITIKS